MKNIVYVFGNEDLSMDNVVYEHLDRLKSDFDKLQFVKVTPNSDLPFAGSHDVIIFDTIEGIEKPQIFTESDISKIKLSPRTSVHDFDLGFQLKYLLKLGKLKKVRIVGLPMHKEPDYSSIHDIFKKLVAQDIQGS